MEKVRLWRGQPADRGRLKNRTKSSASQLSGVDRNFRQGVRQSVAFLYAHSRSAAYQVGRTIKKRHDISHRLKIMYFPDRGCVRPLRHLYGYATESALTRVG